MGDHLGDLDGYPAGVSNAHSHFHPTVIRCPYCNAAIEITDECPECDHELTEADLETADHA